MRTPILTSPWGRVVAWALVLAVVSLLSNITSVAQLSGEANALLAARFYVSKVVNAGAVWAGLMVLAGWLLRRPAPAAVAGVVSGELALVAHYGLGQLTGIYDSDIWASNLYWFIAPLLFGVPLGLIGAAARRRDLWGLCAGLVVPLGAVLEPWVTGQFRTPAGLALPWPDRYSSIACGVTLIVGGLILGWQVIARWRRHATSDGG
ncbi:MAG: hypothetical protein LWW86_15425 [Micrococcales bacterium]|nr:hypothetical protein [Micrococcales bacterium]